MSLVAPDGPPESLPAVLRRAGAVLSPRGGATVAVNYGSAAGELAVCVRAVGLVDRADLRTLVIEASRRNWGALSPGCWAAPCSPAACGSRAAPGGAGRARTR